MQRMNLTRMIASAFGLDESTAFLIVAVLAVVVFLAVALPALGQWLKKTDDAAKKQVVRKASIALVIAVLAIAGGYTVFRAVPQMRAESAMKDGNYQTAADLYKRLGMLTEEIDARKHMAEAAAAAGDYEEAIAIFDRLNIQNRVRELKVEKAMLDLKAGNEQQALDVLAQMPYQAEAASVLLQHPELCSAVFAPGRSVYLESEWSAIPWHIAAVEDGKALLLYTGLDRDRFHSGSSMTWGDSDIRKALQAYFEENLPEAVRDAVIVTKNENLDSDGYSVSKGETTEDKLFILSKEESQQYLTSLAAALNGQTCWTRTPNEQEQCGIDTAEMILLENGTAEVSITSSAWTVKDNVFPVMWVDVRQLLQNWAEE